MNKRSFHELRGIWLSCLVVPWLSDATEAITLGVLSLHRETKFIIGSDFAVTPSAPASSCVLFDITSEQLVKLKWPMLNKHHKWFHSSRVKFPLFSMSASWFLVSNVFHLDFRGPNWFYRRTKQEQLCGFWKHVSLSDFFPLWSSWSLLRRCQTHTTKLPDEKNWRLRK